MLPEVRKVLDQVEDVLLGKQGKAAAVDLWSILTALRGPDDGYGDVKSTQTVPIRAAAFPRILRAAGEEFFFGGFQIKSYGESGKLPDPYAMIPTHFTIHIRWAVDALGRK